MIKYIINKTFIAVTAIFLISFFSGCSKPAPVINGIKDLNGLRIGVQTGTTGESWAQNNIEGVILASFKSGLDAALDLNDNAIDAIIIDELPAKEIVSKHPNFKIVYDDYFSQHKEEYAFAVKKGNTKLLDSINSTLNQLKTSGQFDRLIKAFMPENSYIKLPEQKAKTGSFTLTVGTNATFTPFEYIHHANIVGFDISLSQEIAENCGAKLEIENLDFSQLILALNTETIDFIAAAFSITEERSQQVDFSQPYFSSQQVIIVKR